MVGRANLMRGNIDTVNEVTSMSARIEHQKTQDVPGFERTQASRSTFMRQAKREESALLSPFKQNSSRLQDLVNKNKLNEDGYSMQSSSHSEDLGTFNSEENEVEIFSKRLAFAGKVKSLMNPGLITNPFQDFDMIDECSSLENQMNGLRFEHNEQVLSKLSLSKNV